MFIPNINYFDKTLAEGILMSSRTKYSLRKKCFRVSFSEVSPCKGFLLHILLIPNFSHSSCITCLHFVLELCHIHIKIKMGREDFWIDRSPIRTPKVGNIKKYIIELPPPPKIIVFTQNLICILHFIIGDYKS